VYSAKDTRLDRIVAIKILPAHLSSDPLRKQRFEREAKTISSLDHPNICVLHEESSRAYPRRDIQLCRKSPDKRRRAGAFKRSCAV
jgi:serine/threonine protein kinase